MPYDWVYRKCDATPIPAHQEQSEFEQNLKCRLIPCGNSCIYIQIVNYSAERLQYRLYRNPAVMLGLGVLFMFLLRNRLPTRWVKRKERTSAIFTNLLIIVMVLVADRFIGWRTFLLIQLPVLCLAGAAGIWLFYVQHQFPGGYWACKSQWEPLRAAMEGCSFYKLPSVLRWFSSNIGYHHVHHLSPRIPNYRLKKCYDAVPALQGIASLTIAKSLSCIRLKMWDEERQKMVAFS
jgi:omega-6 fatty acid desaturase (delta-12 desaturase)